VFVVNLIIVSRSNQCLRSRPTAYWENANQICLVTKSIHKVCDVTPDSAAQHVTRFFHQWRWRIVVRDLTKLWREWTS